MSDRRRRWICQLIFVVACVLPTAWVTLRIVYQPGPDHFARQLQLQLGVPVQLERVTTPTPDLTILHGVSFQHPETGTWATADRWSLCWADSVQLARWQIDHLQLDESNLLDLFEHLHRTVLRQHLVGARPTAEAAGLVMPTLHVQSLEVLSRDSQVSPAAGAPPLALRLKDVTVGWRWNAAAQRPRLEVAAKLLPPRRDRDVLSAGVPLPEVPVLCYLERRPDSLASSTSPNFSTHWEVAVLERPVPVAWINLQAWPATLRSTSAAARFQGLLTGHASERGWRVDCRQAQADGWDLSDLEYAISGRRSRTQAPLQLQIQHLAWVGQAGGGPGWESAQLESAQVECLAENGELAADLVLAATRALTLPSANPAVRQVAHAALESETNSNAMASSPDPLASLTVRFAQLNVGLRWESGQLWLRPIPDSDGPLPLLRGYHGQDLVGWADAVERLWQPELGQPPRPFEVDAAFQADAATTMTGPELRRDGEHEAGSPHTPAAHTPAAHTPTSHAPAAHAPASEGLAVEGARLGAADVGPSASAVQPAQWVGPREPLRIAPIEVAWEPQQFIVGERVADPFPFDPLGKPIETLREQLEEPAGGAGSERL